MKGRDAVTQESSLEDLHPHLQGYNKIKRKLSAFKRVRAWVSVRAYVWASTHIRERKKKDREKGKETFMKKEK